MSEYCNALNATIQYKKALKAAIEQNADAETLYGARMAVLNSLDVLVAIKREEISTALHSDPKLPQKVQQLWALLQDQKKFQAQVDDTPAPGAIAAPPPAAAPAVAFSTTASTIPPSPMPMDATTATGSAPAAAAPATSMSTPSPAESITAPLLISAAGFNPDTVSKATQAKILQDFMATYHTMQVPTGPAAAAAAAAATGPASSTRNKRSTSASASAKSDAVSATAAATKPRKRSKGPVSKARTPVGPRTTVGTPAESVRQLQDKFVRKQLGGALEKLKLVNAMSTPSKNVRKAEKEKWPRNVTMLVNFNNIKPGTGNGGRATKGNLHNKREQITVVSAGVFNREFEIKALEAAIYALKSSKKKKGVVTVKYFNSDVTVASADDAKEVLTELEKEGNGATMEDNEEETGEENEETEDDEDDEDDE